MPSKSKYKLDYNPHELADTVRRAVEKMKWLEEKMRYDVDTVYVEWGAESVDMMYNLAYLTKMRVKLESFMPVTSPDDIPF